LAGRCESEDATVLTRALVSLTLQYLWLVSPDDASERQDRLRRLVLKWATERATLGEELLDLGYLSSEGSPEQVQVFRTHADKLERECVRRVPAERDLAIRIDRDVTLKVPRFFELVYARIYRTSSHVAHYGIGAALAGYVQRPEATAEAHSLERLDREGAADALGLALVTYAALVDLANPVIRHGLTADIEAIVKETFGHGMGTADA
jgi:hypothetical protein